MGHAPSLCQKNKTMLERDKQSIADTACLNVCNSAQDQLRNVEFGHSLNKCEPSSVPSKGTAVQEVEH